MNLLVCPGLGEGRSGRVDATGEARPREAPTATAAAVHDARRKNRREVCSTTNVLYPYARTWHQPCRREVTRRVRMLFLPLCTPAEARDAATAQVWLRGYRQRHPNAPGSAFEALLVQRYGLLFHPRVPMCEHCLKLKRGWISSEARRARGIPKGVVIDPVALGLTSFFRDRLGGPTELPFVRRKHRKCIRLFPADFALPKREKTRNEKPPASFRAVTRVPAEELATPAPGKKWNVARRKARPQKQGRVLLTALEAAQVVTRRERRAI